MWQGGCSPARHADRATPHQPYQRILTAEDIFMARPAEHGRWRTPEYIAWSNMIQRTTNPKNNSYKNYGGRGISVCLPWLDFKNFFADVGCRPTPKHQIDRIDNNGDYEPGNCRWVTNRQNTMNQRKSQHWYINGVRYESQKEASSSTGISVQRIRRMCKNNIDNCWHENKYL